MIGTITDDLRLIWSDLKKRNEWSLVSPSEELLFLERAAAERIELKEIQSIEERSRLAIIRTYSVILYHNLLERNERAAFELWSFCYRLARRGGHTQEDSEAIAQETIHQLLLRLKGLESPRNLIYLTQYLCLDVSLKIDTSPLKPEEERISQHILNQQLIRQLQKKLRNPFQIQVVIRSLLLGDKPEDVARELDIPLVSIRLAKARALKILRGDPHFLQFLADLANESNPTNITPLPKDLTFTVHKFKNLINDYFAHINLYDLSNNTPTILLLEGVYIQLKCISQLSETFNDFTPEKKALVSSVLNDPKHRSVIVLGDHGSGKSILLQFLAFCFAQGPATVATHLHLEGDDADRIPIFVPLAAYDDMLNETPSLTVTILLVEFYNRQLSDSSIDVVFEHILSEGKAIILLDGLDEVVSEPRRQFVVEQINKFIQEVVPKGNRVVLTSRIDAYQATPLSLDTVTHVTLQPFEQEEIASFARQWFRALRIAEKQGILTSQDEMDIQANERWLLDIIQKNEGKSIEITPLLLTMLALLADQNKPISIRSLTIYDEYICSLVLQSYESRGKWEGLNRKRLQFDIKDVEVALLQTSSWLQTNANRMSGHDELPPLYQQALAIIESGLGFKDPETASKLATMSLFPNQYRLFTRFEKTNYNGPIIVSDWTPLIVWVGPFHELQKEKSGESFIFEFPPDSDQATFEVSVKTDAQGWNILSAEPIMIINKPGITVQEAVFTVISHQAGKAVLYITVKQRDTEAIVHHLWLEVSSVEPKLDRMENYLEPSLLPRETELVDKTNTPHDTTHKSNTRNNPSSSEVKDQTNQTRRVSFPLDSNQYSPRNITITLQPSAHDSSRYTAYVHAVFPDGWLVRDYQINIQVQLIQQLTKKLRASMDNIVQYAERAGHETILPFCSPKSVTVSESAARQAISRLADAGQLAWRNIFEFTENKEFQALGHQIRNLPEESKIQFILKSSDFVIPWSLLYDRLEPVKPENVTWQGFWGYRYIIDTLLPGTYPSPVIDNLLTALYALLNQEDLSQYSQSQAKHIQHKLQHIRTFVLSGQDACNFLAQGPVSGDIVYCFCHGEDKSKRLSSEWLPIEAKLKFSKNAQIRLADINTKAISQPLVFLNACDTSALQPFHRDGFASFFLKLWSARAFIGSEIEIPQLFAHDFALRFWEQFANGVPVGNILWQLRRHYLKMHHNVLGFSYSLYGLGDTRLNYRSE